MIKKRTASQRLHMLMEMLSCNGMYYISSSPLSRLEPDVPKEIVCLQSVFRDSGCETFLWESVKRGDPAVILWSRFDLMWICVCSDYEDAENEVLVIGPVRSKETSNESIENYLKQQETLPSQIQARSLLAALPRASYDTIYRHTAFLAYCIRGEKLSLSQIVFQRGTVLQFRDPAADPPSLIHKDTHLLFDLVYDRIYSGVVPEIPFSASLMEGLSFPNNPLRDHRIHAVAISSIAIKAAMDAGAMPARVFQLSQNRLSPMMKDGATPADAVSALEVTLRELAEMVYGLRHRADAADPIVQCMAYIDAHPDADIDLELLAAQVHYSKYYLTRKFKEGTGQSIVDYIQKAKIDRAQILLRTTRMSLSEIASALSLSSASYLGQLIKKHTGQTAAQYRKTCRRLS
ncbi:MAG: helix-turn-helix transcriptional regulator [Lachnospiraceae bacterium]|nr:helix-turn-helix transcriptional regulator [Lachnospiraceae bacterium]